MSSFKLLLQKQKTRYTYVYLLQAHCSHPEVEHVLSAVVNHYHSGWITSLFIAQKLRIQLSMHTKYHPNAHMEPITMMVMTTNTNTMITNTL